MEIKNIANFHFHRLKNEIILENNSIFHRFPVDEYMKNIKFHSQYSGFNYLKYKLRNFFEQVSSEYNAQTAASYHKFALTYFIKDSIELLERINLSNSTRDLYTDWFKRVLQDFSHRPDSYYDHERDCFLKDLAVCSLMLIPVGGAWAVEVSRASIGFVFTGGMRQFFEYLAFILFRTQGLKPFYVIHTVRRLLAYFTPEERKKCYLRIAKLLERNPGVKGMYASGWLYDPELVRVSPELAYLREEPERNGARLFRKRSTPETIKNATLLSPTRQELYAEGKYIPCGYALIWPRGKLLEWASKQETIYS